MTIERANSSSYLIAIVKFALYVTIFSYNIRTRNVHGHDLVIKNTHLSFLGYNVPYLSPFTRHLQNSHSGILTLRIKVKLNEEKICAYSILVPLYESILENICIVFPQNGV